MYSIAVLSPISSKNTGWRSIEDSHIFKFFIPSFIKTVSKDIKCTCYLGIDSDEPVCTEDELKRIFKGTGINVDVTVYDSTVEKGHVTKMWNILYKKAHDTEQHDYYYQCGDDIMFLTEGWLDRSINCLKDNNDVGVSSPIVMYKGKKVKILTSVLVSNEHMKIFGRLFPEQIRNWYCDDWINDVYSPDNRFDVDSHHIRNMGKGRYDIVSKSRYYQDHTSTDRDKVLKYLSLKNRGEVTTE